MLASFSGDKGKAAGRIVLGIAFIFLGIDQIKTGFSSFGGMDLSQYHAGGLTGQLLFVGIGLLATVVLQSSHATLMLTLTALAAGQLDLTQALATAIGANIGTSVTTAFVGSLGGNRSGQRLAPRHVLFNVTTAIPAIALLPTAWLVQWLVAPLGLGENRLIQLALFHSLFNGMGVLLFCTADAAGKRPAARAARAGRADGADHRADANAGGWRDPCALSQRAGAGFGRCRGQRGGSGAAARHA